MTQLLNEAFTEEEMNTNPTQQQVSDPGFTRLLLGGLRTARRQNRWSGIAATRPH